MTKRLCTYLFPAVLALGSTGALHAQRPAISNIPRPSGPAQAPQQRAGEQRADETPDTVGIHLLLAERPEQETPFSDSLLDRNFHQYDPARQRDIDYMTTGNAGGAARFFAYEPVFRRALDVGFHQFDIYHIPAGALPFYRLQKAYTDLAFYQQGEQADSYLTARFARNFAGGVHVAVDYKRLSHIGNLNQYPEQNSRQTAIASGIRLRSAGGRYDGFLAFAANTSEQEDNGGILREPTGVEGRPNTPANADVFLRAAQTRHSLRELLYTQHWRIGGRTDSTGSTRRAFPVMHRIAWTDARYKFFDREPQSHTAFYEWFPQLLVDERGVRYFIHHRKLENTLQIATLRKGRQASDLIEAGLVHTLNFVRLEPVDTTVNNLFLTGRMALSPSPVLRFEGKAHLGLLGNAGDYRLQGELELNLPKTGSLQLRFLNQLYSPTLVQHRFYLTQQNMWNNSFGKTLETGLSATLAAKALNLDISGAYYLLNNFVYFDTTATPRQTGVPLSILQLILHQRLKLWKIHLHNTAVIQKASEPIIRLPEIFSKHSLYYEGRWFKVLQVRLGLDLRLNTPWMADYYNPIVGQFQLQNRQQVPFYPAADAFISLRIAAFRAYVKWEDLGDFFIPNRYYYQSAFYAQPFPGLRLALKWRLAD